MDSRNHSLADFIKVENADMMERARLFKEFSDDLVDKRHAQYRRVSLDGSGPVMKVKDQYTGEVRERL